MLPELDVLKPSSLFENPAGLVGYAERLARTERAMVSMELLARLAYLAGQEIILSNKDAEKLKKKKGVVSLHDHNYATLIPIARKRINRGEIPDNWLLGFMEYIDTCQSTTTAVTIET